MKNHITDEKTGIGYTLQGDYYLPDLALPVEEEQPIGIWGQRHRRYLKEQNRSLYCNLLTACKLNSYLADINRQAEELFSRRVKQMAECGGVAEALKVQNQMAWVGRMNNIYSRATEIVNNDVIYDLKKEGATEAMINPKAIIEDAPKIFWKYYDLFRRKKITLAQYSESTELTITEIEKFLGEIVGKRSKPIEKPKQI